jgi:hypothetical protein
MKLGLIIFGITGFLIFNTYHDGKYTEMLKIGKKYIQMIMYGFIGLTLWLFIKKHPDKSKDMLAHASDVIRYMPIDRNTSDFLSPIFDFTKAKNLLNNNIAPGHKRMMNSGNQPNSRSVSETKKKYVASQQQWKCGKCQRTLDAAYQIDHKLALYKGGTNNIDNLEALCRNCHGEKTVYDKII